MLKTKINSRPLLLTITAIVITLAACKKNETGPTGIPFDPAFVGVWYSDSNAVGFEVLSDGSSKNLEVDSAGTLQYAISGSNSTSPITLTLLSASNGNLMANERYHIQGFIDTTVAIPGVYTFSNNNNTLSISFPNPSSPGQLYTIVFVRSSIGAVVRPRTSSARLTRRQ